MDGDDNRKGGDTVQRGKFIVFEGIDGAGKSTQIELLATALRARGRTVVTTAEPTDNDTGRMLRAALSGDPPRTGAQMAAMFVLDRIGHSREINELLERGTDVICDRYYYSSLAYQGSICDYDWVRHMNCDCPDIIHPDLCVFLDLAPAAALARINRRGMATEIYEKEETLARVRTTFHRVFETLPDRVAIIDAAGTADEVGVAVKTAVDQIYNNI